MDTPQYMYTTGAVHVHYLHSICTVFVKYTTGGGRGGGGGGGREGGGEGRREEGGRVREAGSRE